MSTQPVAIQQLSIEDKILLAAQQAESVVSIFSPMAAQAVAAGVQVEPVISGLAKLIVGLFHHHTGVKPVPAA